MDEQKRREALEHRDAILATASFIKTAEGNKLFKYLFKSFDVGQEIPQHMEGNFLHDYLGFKRAGTSIFKLASEADPEVAASILSKLERERYDELCEEYRSENGIE